MKKLFIILLLGIFLISFASSLEFDNIKTLPDISKDIYIGDKLIEYNELWEKYPVVEIDNWLGLGETLFSGALTEHTESCGSSCFSELEIYLANDGVLIDETIFETILGDGSRIEEPVINYKWQYYDGKNWYNYYEGDEVSAGNYKIRINAEKYKTKTVDWIIKTNGEWLNELAIWRQQDSITEAHNITLGSASTSTAYRGMNITVGDTDVVLINITKHSDTQTNGTAVLWDGVGCKTLASATFDGNTATFSNEPNSNVTLKAGGSYAVLVYASGDVRFGAFSPPVQGTYVNWTKGIFSGCGSQNDEANEIVSIGLAPVYLNVTLNSPEDNNITKNTEILFNATADSPAGADIENMSLYTNESGTWEIKNTTSGISGSNKVQTWTRTMAEGNYIWNVETCTSAGTCAFGLNNYSLFIDLSSPTFSVEAPSDTLNYGLVGGNETLNITFTDANLDSCWYNYNGTNITIAGCLTGIKNSTNFLLELGNTNMTIYANDTAGNENSTFISWDYYVLEISQSFSTQVTEGITTRISSNLTLSSGQRLSSADLNYNGTLYSGSTNEYSTNNWFVYYDLNVPQVSTDTNITFFWNLTFEDDTTLLTQLNNQTILNIAIDNCSSYTNTLFNFSVLDEDTQTILNATGDNVSIIVDLSFYNPNNNELIFNFSQEYKQTNPARVCVEDSLVEEAYRLDGVVQYSANNRFKEFYNFQNYSLNNETDATLINLYDLNSTLGQEFKITYKDENFNTVPGAVIQIQRKYIGEGVFKVVELPLFGSQGYAIAHLIRDDVIYNFIILEDGEVLGTFENIVANCQNPTISDCEININSFSSTVSPEDFSNDGAFVAKLTYNSTSRVVSTTYSITSGAPEQTNLNVTLWDSYLNQSVCSDGLYSAGGTLSCTIPAQFGNTTVYIELSSDSDVKRTAVFILNTDPQSIYGANLIFLSLCIMLFIIGMSTSDNPLTLGIMLIVGTIILITLNMVSSLGWFGQGATILWLIVAIAIILIKGSNRQ